jgi:hypothetical protein
MYSHGLLSSGLARAEVKDSILEMLWVLGWMQRGQKCDQHYAHAHGSAHTPHQPT